MTDNQLVYTVKETVTKLADQNAKMEERQIKMDVTLNQILEQAIKTNGRITKNENDIITLKSEHTKWKAIFSTVIAIGGAVWTGVTFIFK